MKFSKNFNSVVAKLGWQIRGLHDSDGYIEFAQYSPAGEDFSFEIEKGTEEEIIERIGEYARDFDVDEHASLYVGTNCGAPNSLSVLLQDANAIKQMLLDLFNELSGNDIKPCDLTITDDDLSSKDRKKIMDLVNEYLAEHYGSCSGGYGYEIEIRLTDIDWENQ